MRRLPSGHRTISALGCITGLIGVLLVTLASDELHAQTVLGTASLYQLPMLGHEQATVIEPQSGDVAGDRSRVRAALRHLPLSRDGWRVEGEIGTLTWRSYLTGPAAASAMEFRIAYESAASVLPMISQLALRINGVEIGRTGIAAPGDIAPIDFRIPAGVLRPGFNEVAISVDQRHRVDCSPEATYELWTRIDPVRTGFVNGGNSAVSKLTDLAALNPVSDGSLAIRVLFDGRLRPQRIDQIILAAQAIALSGQFERTSISFGSEPQLSSSVNLIVGTAPEVSRLLAVFGERSEISGPTLLLAPAGVGAAPALIATGRTDDDIGRAIDQLITIATNHQQASSEPGRSAARTELKIIGGERVSFEQLGISHREFSGRLFRLPINLDMPPDMLVADYGRLSINLSGAYAAGLRGDARVQVQLNGRTAASVPMSKPSGGLFRHNDVIVPLTAMRPGANVLEITATLPQESDRRCDSAVPLDKAAPRFLLLGDTEIRFPQIARVGQMPDLAQTMAGGYPYSIRGSQPKLYVPSPDRESLAAAVALAVRMSVVAGHPIRFSLVVANPTPGSGPALVVAPAPALDPALMASIGLDPNAVRLAWQRVKGQGDQVTDATLPNPSRPADTDDQGARPRLLSVALRGTSGAGSAPSEPSLTDIATRGAPSDVWTDMLQRRSLIDRAAELAHLVTDKSVAVAGSAAAMLRGQFGSRLASSGAAIDSATSLIVAQGYRSPESDDIVTIVTAPDAKTLARAVNALVEPVAWSGPRGRLALLSETARLLDTVQANDVRLIETQPVSFGNARLIAAGWLSLHPASYVIAALLLAALLAITSRALVKNVGRKNS